MSGGLLHSIGLLLVGRGAVVPVAPLEVEAAGEERLILEFRFNRETEEIRVMSNMSLDTARDVYDDLGTLSKPKARTHMYHTALGSVFTQKGVPH